MEQTPKISINLVTYNGQKFLPFCLNSLLEQTFQDFSVLIVDNGSSDQTMAYLKENWPQLKVLSYDKNLGFAKAHNQAITWTKSDYVMVLNQDVILDKNYLQVAVDFLNSHPNCASVQGKVYRWNFEDQEKTAILDSLGLKVYKSHRVIDLGQGETDLGQYKETQEIFGTSGALPIYRRSYLEKTKVFLSGGSFKPEYFDEDFFAYKEDVDLAFRLRLAGGQSFYLPKAIAWHQRSVQGAADLSDEAVRLSRQTKDKMVRMHSYKNHLMVIYKNEFKANLLKYFWPIFWYELKKLAYLVLFEQSTLSGLKIFLQKKSRLKMKRKYIFKNICKIKAGDLAKWYE